jgi:nucleotide-binding universal stress UspA family protein
MEPIVACAFDPGSGDRAPVDFARLAAGLLGAQLVIVVVRPGGSATERLSRLEPGLGTPLHAVVPARATLLEVDAPSPAAGLHRVLAAERPALAVAGSAASAMHGRVGLGTTGERLLDGAPCPVAIVPRGWSERPLVAVAAAVLPSPEGRAALDLASALARAAGVPLRVVMVLSDSPDEAEASALARALTPEEPEATVAGGGGGASVLRPALASAALGGGARDVDPDVYVGDPADTLVRASARAGLLVLGSRAYGSAVEVHAGGVARRVLAAARCPVVLVPRETAAQSGGGGAPGRLRAEK